MPLSLFRGYIILKVLFLISNNKVRIHGAIYLKQPYYMFGKNINYQKTADIRANFCFAKTVPDWNRLPEVEVCFENRALLFFQPIINNK